MRIRKAQAKGLLRAARKWERTLQAIADVHGGLEEFRAQQGEILCFERVLIESENLARRLGLAEGEHELECDVARVVLAVESTGFVRPEIQIY